MDHKSRRHMPHVVFPLFVSHFSHSAIGIKQQEEMEGGEDGTHRSRARDDWWRYYH